MDTTLRTAEMHHGERTVQTFLSFTLGRRSYGVPMADIIDIVGIKKTLSLWRGRPFVRGIIKLRNTVVPIVDLSSRLERGRRSNADEDFAIVIRVGKAGNAFTVGFVVDSLNDFLSLPDAQLSEFSESRPKTMPPWIGGLGLCADGSAAVILSVEKLLGEDAAYLFGLACRPIVCVQ